MGLFPFGKKKKKQSTERNEIDNTQLKETLANSALGTLTEGQDYAQLAYTKIQFGYLFDIDDHGLEALFKVVTDQGVFYFAAQGTSLMRLNFSEELFESTTNTFLSLHK